MFGSFDTGLLHEIRSAPPPPPMAAAVPVTAVNAADASPKTWRPGGSQVHVSQEGRYALSLASGWCVTIRQLKRDGIIIAGRKKEHLCTSHCCSITESLQYDTSWLTKHAFHV